MTRKLSNYLRTYRRRAHLSQDEVAFLLGGRTGEHVSRHERFSRVPSLRKIFAYEIFLGVSAHELFAGLYQETERQTRARIATLVAKIDQGRVSRRTAHKLAHLRKVAAPDGHEPIQTHVKPRT